jgi:VanZ family protein
LLFALSSYSKAPAGTPDFFMWSDKVAHAIYFTAGSAALYWALTLGSIDAKSLLAPTACLLAAALVGWFDEWHQTFTPGRSGNDLGDWIADMIGGALGYILGRIGLPLIQRDASPCPQGTTR